MAKMQDDSYVVVHAERVHKRAGDVEDYVFSVIKKDLEYYNGKYQGWISKMRYRKLFLTLPVSLCHGH